MGKRPIGPASLLPEKVVSLKFSAIEAAGPIEGAEGIELVGQNGSPSGNWTGDIRVGEEGERRARRTTDATQNNVGSGDDWDALAEAIRHSISGEPVAAGVVQRAAVDEGRVESAVGRGEGQDGVGCVGGRGEQGSGAAEKLDPGRKGGSTGFLATQADDFAPADRELPKILIAQPDFTELAGTSDQCSSLVPGRDNEGAW